MSPETSRKLNFLCGCLGGSVTMTTKDCEELLLETGGNCLAQGRLYNFKVQHIGVGVQRVTLELANP